MVSSCSRIWSWLLDINTVLVLMPLVISESQLWYDVYGVGRVDLYTLYCICIYTNCICDCVFFYCNWFIFWILIVTHNALEFRWIHSSIVAFLRALPLYLKRMGFRLSGEGGRGNSLDMVFKALADSAFMNISRESTQTI